jgi:hypothetical protein
MKKRAVDKRGQVTVFIILGLIIVALISGYFIFQNTKVQNVPPNLAPVYNYYSSCIEKTIQTGTNIMASQGGYLELPEFSPGSTYAPFSSQLGFVGLAIPYWYYISGNGIQKEQVPTKSDMQSQISNYIKQEISNCDFTFFVNQGYNITLGEATVKTTINEDKITAVVNQKMTVVLADSSYTLNSHIIDVNSNFGKLYDLAKKIYDYEKKSMFLENYSRDVLYTYAPVDGVLINCSPAIWNPYSVIDELKTALTANIASIRMQGNYYEQNPSINYFIAGKDANIDLLNNQVSFLYSGDWPSRFEVWPTQNNLMLAQPIGNQAGLGVIGFCYIPYKFVYDLYFPVLIQIYNPSNADEIFQFPMAIVINKNSPREPIVQETTEDAENICDNANTEIEVNTLNINLDPVEADISFKCLDSLCSLGRTKINNASGFASLNAEVPQCLNGIIIASAAGYKQNKQILSTNEEYTSNIVLDKEYSLALEVYVDNILTKNMAVVSVYENSANSSIPLGSLAYPNNNEIKLAEADYTFDVRIYGNGNVVIPGSTTKECINAPKTGIAGLFGLEEQKCYDMEIPSQTINNLLTAGGMQRQYITSGELEKAKILRIYTESITAPNNLDMIQSSYNEVMAQKLDIQLV